MALDLKSLTKTVQDTKLAPVQRGRSAGPLVFLDVVKDSYAKKSGKQVGPIPLANKTTKSGDDENVVAVKNEVRRAGRSLGYGITFETVINKRDKTALVKFLARDAQKRPRKDKTDEATETPATENASEPTTEGPEAATPANESTETPSESAVA